ncbi:uncharacterized protein LOC120865211 [Oryx dammah]|uniref:uncharacterized protein LOC120865211 n=1 Tax=Oryx dammah TaxID=59534 RepID=UPI001A9AA3D7|nr:uncharacterized protein LOC120865211 [Oryx dammah]
MFSPPRSSATAARAPARAGARSIAPNLLGAQSHSALSARGKGGLRRRAARAREASFLGSSLARAPLLSRLVHTAPLPYPATFPPSARERHAVTAPGPDATTHLQAARPPRNIRHLTRPYQEPPRSGSRPCFPDLLPLFLAPLAGVGGPPFLQTGLFKKQKEKKKNPQSHLLALSAIQEAGCQFLKEMALRSTSRFGKPAELKETAATSGHCVALAPLERRAPRRTRTPSDFPDHPGSMLRLLATLV